jgi:hypothetical protein
MRRLGSLRKSFFLGEKDFGKRIAKKQSRLEKKETFANMHPNYTFPSLISAQ